MSEEGGPTGKATGYSGDILEVELTGFDDLLDRVVRDREVLRMTARYGRVEHGCTGNRAEWRWQR